MDDRNVVTLIAMLAKIEAEITKRLDDLESCNISEINTMLNDIMTQQGSFDRRLDYCYDQVESMKKSIEAVNKEIENLEGHDD